LITSYSSNTSSYSTIKGFSPSLFSPLLSPKNIIIVDKQINTVPIILNIPGGVENNNQSKIYPKKGQVAMHKVVLIAEVKARLFDLRVVIPVKLIAIKINKNCSKNVGYSILTNDKS